MQTISKIIKKHTSVLSASQAQHYESIIRDGLRVYVDSFAKEVPYNNLDHNLAFVVLRSDRNYGDQKSMLASCAKLPKRTINSLVKKGVLKKIEIQIAWEFYVVYIIDGFGMTGEQTGDSWLQSSLGIDPNADLKEERETRKKVIEEIRIHIQKQIYNC